MHMVFVDGNWEPIVCCAVQVWDMDTGDICMTLTWDSTPLTALAVVPNGSLAVTGNDGGVLALWSLASGVVVKRLTGHTGT
jgi:WD40 repeat protein